MSNYQPSVQLAAIVGRTPRTRGEFIDALVERIHAKKLSGGPFAQGESMLEVLTASEKRIPLVELMNLVSANTCVERAVVAAAEVVARRKS